MNISEIVNNEINEVEKDKTESLQKIQEIEYRIAILHIDEINEFFSTPDKATMLKMQLQNLGSELKAAKMNKDFLFSRQEKLIEYSQWLAQDDNENKANEDLKRVISDLLQK